MSYVLNTEMNVTSHRDDFDPGRWEATADTTSMPAGSAQPGRSRKAAPTVRHGKFLKGPVPWPWLLRAMLLPGKALAVGLLLWREAGCQRTRAVHFCLTRAAADGIPTTTARRAIRHLEGAGLVRIRRRPGRGLDVIILDPPHASMRNAEAADSGP
jgi:hypothetical protein